MTQNTQAVLSSRWLIQVESRSIPNSDQVTNFQLTFALEKQIMHKVGELIVKSEIRSDPVKCAIKEKEDVFDLKAEQAKIDAMATQGMFGGGMPGMPAQQP